MLSKPEYDRYVIKQYRNWTLFLHETQSPYVGRCYAWWKDREPVNGENLPLSLLTEPALVELFQTIFADVCRACRALGHKTIPYGPEFLLNTCYLANDPVHNHHMHVHFVPRFSKPLHIGGIGDFVDGEWGGPFKHGKSVGQVSDRCVEIIRKTMADAIL